MLIELGQKEEAVKILDGLAKDDECEIRSSEESRTPPG